VIERYLRILGARMRLAVALAAQYRWDFVVEGPTSLLAILTGLVIPLVAFAGGREEVAGWSFPEVLLVVGWFTALKGFFSAMFFPSLLELSTNIRDGKLDFFLLKPGDALFNISTSRFELWRLLDFVVGSVVIGVAFALRGEAPALRDVAVAAVLLVAAAVALYSLCVLVGSAAFFAVRMEGLPFVFTSILDFARWPVTLFQGVVRIVFTFVIPLAIMTTYPALAVLGRLDGATALWAFLGAALLFLAARSLFSRAVGRYTSASS
jgi:ABC-2 type transport system permease protein